MKAMGTQIIGKFPYLYWIECRFAPEWLPYGVRIQNPESLPWLIGWHALEWLTFGTYLPLEIGATNDRFSHKRTSHVR